MGWSGVPPPGSARGKLCLRIYPPLNRHLNVVVGSICPADARGPSLFFACIGVFGEMAFVPLPSHGHGHGRRGGVTDHCGWCDGPRNSCPPSLAHTPAPPPPTRTPERGPEPVLVLTRHHRSTAGGGGGCRGSGRLCVHPQPLFFATRGRSRRLRGTGCMCTARVVPSPAHLSGLHPLPVRLRCLWAACPRSVDARCVMGPAPRHPPPRVCSCGPITWCAAVRSSINTLLVGRVFSLHAVYSTIGSGRLTEGTCFTTLTHQKVRRAFAVCTPGSAQHVMCARTCWSRLRVLCRTAVPPHLLHAFDLVVVDPPFITREVRTAWPPASACAVPALRESHLFPTGLPSVFLQVWEKYSVTARLLAKEGVDGAGTGGGCAPPQTRNSPASPPGITDTPAHPPGVSLFLLRLFPPLPAFLQARLWASCYVAPSLKTQT